MDWDEVSSEFCNVYIDTCRIGPHKRMPNAGGIMVAIYIEIET